MNSYSNLLRNVTISSNVFEDEAQKSVLTVMVIESSPKRGYGVQANGRASTGLVVSLAQMNWRAEPGEPGELGGIGMHL